MFTSSILVFIECFAQGEIFSVQSNNNYLLQYHTNAWWVGLIILLNDRLNALFFEESDAWHIPADEVNVENLLLTDNSLKTTKIHW